MSRDLKNYLIVCGAILLTGAAIGILAGRHWLPKCPPVELPVVSYDSVENIYRAREDSILKLKRIDTVYAENIKTTYGKHSEIRNDGVDDNELDSLLRAVIVRGQIRFDSIPPEQTGLDRIRD